MYPERFALTDFPDVYNPTFRPTYQCFRQAFYLTFNYFFIGPGYCSLLVFKVPVCLRVSF